MKELKPFAAQLWGRHFDLMINVSTRSMYQNSQHRTNGISNIIQIMNGYECIGTDIFMR